MQRFLSFLQSQAALDGKFIEMITNSVQQLNLYHTEHLYIENQAISHIYFLLEGLVCSTEKTDGRDVLTSFWEPMEFIVPNSVNKRTYFESTETVHLLEDSKLVKIKVEDIEKSLEYPVGRYLYNYFVNVEFKKQHAIAQFLRVYKVKERVKYLSDNHPVLLRHLNHEQLASFIGTSHITSNLYHVLARFCTVFKQ